MVRIWSSFGMLPGRHHVQHRRQHVREQLQPAHGACGESQRVGDRLFVPALAFQRLCRPPDVDTVHRRADEVLGNRAIGVRDLVGVADQHVDDVKLGGDRGIYAAVAGLTIVQPASVSSRAAAG